MLLPICYRFFCVFRWDEGALQFQTMSFMVNRMLQIATCNCCLVLFNSVWELTNKLDICTILYLHWDTHWHNVHNRDCYICPSPFWNRNNVMYHGICEFVLWKENVVIAFQKLQDCNILKSIAIASSLRAKRMFTRLRALQKVLHLSKFLVTISGKFNSVTVSLCSWLVFNALIHCSMLP